ncbi:MAG: hypothetical protein WBP59_06940 [Ilumatobacteraceae bacterium]
MAHAATEQRFAVDLGRGCATTDEGEVWCWGDATDGGLGDGRSGVYWENLRAPIPVRAQISDVVQSSGSCAIGSTGVVSCWGAAAIIEDGEGSLYSRPPWSSAVPRTYGFATSSKSAGRCAITLAGGVQCQGWNNVGQLGNGSPGWPETSFARPPPSSATAVAVSGLTGVIDLTSAGGFTCALKSDGTVWCWGLNSDGQLGDGQSGSVTHACTRDGGCTDRRYEKSPIQVPGITDAISVHQSCAIRTGGKVSCWGRNSSQRFLAGNASAVLTPTEIPEFEGAIDLDVSSNSTCVVYSDGTAACRGGGNALGGGVLALENVREIESGTYESRCARTADGFIACWGRNDFGEVGNGTYGWGQVVATPQFVIGFGGELPEPDVTVAVTFEPTEVLLELDDGGEPVEQDIVATVEITNTSTEDVEDVRLENVLERYLDRGPERAIEQRVYPDLADLQWDVVPAGESRTIEFPLVVTNYGDFGVGATVRWDIPGTADRASATGRAKITVELDDGFEVEITGETTEDPSWVKLTAKIRNTTNDLLPGITWATGGMQLDIIDGVEPLGLGAPSRGLPDSLVGHEEVIVKWAVQVTDIGVGVFGLQGNATTALGTPAEAFEELSAEINAGLIRSIDLQRQAVAGLDRHLSSGAAEGKALTNQTVSDVVNETEQLRQQEYESWRGLGFDDTTANFLASGAVQREAINNYFGGLVDGAETAITNLGAQDGESLWRLYDTITDPVKREAFAERAVQMARDELGYLESGFSNPSSLGAVDLQVAYDSWSGAATEAKSSIEFAATGQADIWRIEAGEFAADPVAFGTKVGNRHGGQGATVAYYTAAGVAEEFATGGLGPVTRVGKTVEGGVDALRKTSRGAEAVEAGADTFGSATRQFVENERRIERFQDKAYGADVSAADLERLGGFSATDANRINGIVEEIKTKYDVDVEMVFRTAEPMSVGIDGVGKRAFTKEKAVGQLDLMLGAPPSLAGKVTIFEPTPVPRAVLEEIEWDNPGFTARYQERLQIQQKNWDAFQAGGAKTQRIAEASAKYDGVTVLNGAPGHNTYGVEFLEQLDDPAYMATRTDLTPSQVTEIRNHPTTTYTNLQIDNVDGAFTVSDVVRTGQNPDGSWITQKKPVISDYDGQAVLPVGGEWPAGKRGQVETYIKTEMDKIGRSGRHGWSDAANDLPSEYFDLAAEYTMSTTHPAVARRVAEDLERRFDLLAGEFERKADRLVETIGDVPGELLLKRQNEITRLRAKAASFRALTADSILKKWPPGEKTIVFTAGRITVGSNQGLGG